MPIRCFLKNSSIYESIIRQKNFQFGIEFKKNIISTHTGIKDLVPDLLELIKLKEPFGSPHPTKEHRCSSSEGAYVVLDLYLNMNKLERNRSPWLSA